MKTTHATTDGRQPTAIASLLACLVAVGTLSVAHAGDYPDMDQKRDGADSGLRADPNAPDPYRGSGDADRTDFHALEPVPVAPASPADENAFGQDIHGPVDPTYMEPDILDDASRD